MIPVPGRNSVLPQEVHTRVSVVVFVAAYKPILPGLFARAGTRGPGALSIGCRGNAGKTPKRGEERFGNNFATGQRVWKSLYTKALASHYPGEGNRPRKVPYNATRRALFHHNGFPTGIGPSAGAERAFGPVPP